MTPGERLAANLDRVDPALRATVEEVLEELRGTYGTIGRLGHAIADEAEGRLPRRPDLTDRMRAELDRQARELRDRMVPRDLGPLMRSAREGVEAISPTTHDPATCSECQHARRRGWMP